MAAVIQIDAQKQHEEALARLAFPRKATARNARRIKTPRTSDPLSLAEYRLREHRVDALRYVDGLSDVQICGE